MTDFQSLRKLFPNSKNEEIPWDALFESPFGVHLEKMKETPQNPRWHAEGDVYTHTKMVLEALVSSSEYITLNRREKEILFTAALLHDVAKPYCTVYEDGEWKSPRHTIKGAEIARELLWRDFNLCGASDTRAFREAVCTLIRFHGTPVHLGDRAVPERVLIDIAAYGELISDFSLKMLKILVSADLIGRIAEDTEAQLDESEYAFLMAGELGIFDKPYVFPSSYTKHAYLSGKNVSLDYDIYDPTWGEVILVSGLPGTGKDTWISKNYPDLPMISLDEIRRTLGISPTDKDGQGRVIAKAKGEAEKLLRLKRSFVWNATNITYQMRKKHLDLFERYGAKTHIVFLETDINTELLRNRERAESVPESVIYKLLSKTEPPAIAEAHTVEWITV